MDSSEIALRMVEAWLKHESEVSHEIGSTSVKGESKSVKEVAQAYLDFMNTAFDGVLPENLTKEKLSEDDSTQ